MGGVLLSPDDQQKPHPLPGKAGRQQLQSWGEGRTGFPDLATAWCAQQQNERVLSQARHHEEF